MYAELKEQGPTILFGWGQTTLQRLDCLFKKGTWNLLKTCHKISTLLDVAL